MEQLDNEMGLHPEDADPLRQVQRAKPKREHMKRAQMQKAQMKREDSTRKDSLMSQQPHRPSLSRTGSPGGYNDGNFDVNGIQKVILTPWHLNA
jgi:hypothetical protein